MKLKSRHFADKDLSEKSHFLLFFLFNVRRIYLYIDFFSWEQQKRNHLPHILACVHSQDSGDNNRPLYWPTEHAKKVPNAHLNHQRKKVPKNKGKETIHDWFVYSYFSVASRTNNFGQSPTQTSPCDEPILKTMDESSKYNWSSFILSHMQPQQFNTLDMIVQTKCWIGLTRKGLQFILL